MKSKCPGDSALVRLFMEECAPREKDRVLRHLAGCSRCSLRFDVLRQLKRDLRPKVDAFAGEFDAAAAPLLRRAARESAQASKPKPFASFLSLKLAVGLLGVLVVASAAAFIALGPMARRSELRSPSLRLTLVAPIGSVSAPPALFRWTPVLDAESYRIDLTDDALVTVYSARNFLVNEHVLPSGVQSKLIRGRVYLWTVTATDGDSNRLATRSGSFVIE